MTAVESSEPSGRRGRPWWPGRLGTLTRAVAIVAATGIVAASLAQGASADSSPAASPTQTPTPSPSTTAAATNAPTAPATVPARLRTAIPSSPATPSSTAAQSSVATPAPASTPTPTPTTVRHTVDGARRDTGCRPERKSGARAGRCGSGYPRPRRHRRRIPTPRRRRRSRGPGHIRSEMRPGRRGLHADL